MRSFLMISQVLCATALTCGTAAFATAPSPGTDTDDCAQLQQSYEAFQVDNFCDFSTGLGPDYWVGGYITTITVAAPQGTEDNGYTFRFDDKESLVIDSPLVATPYKVGMFYKFNMAGICTHMTSAELSGTYADANFTQLTPLSCTK